MSFILAIILAVVVFGKIALDNSEKKASDREFAQAMEKFSDENRNWIDKVVDKQLEEQLEQDIYIGANREQFLEEVKQAYSDMGKDTSNIFMPRKTELLRILLARRGKLRYVDAENGIENFVSILKPTPTEGKRNYESQLKFAVWMNGQLKAHGINEELVLVGVDELCYKIEDSRWRMGRYKWRPQKDSPAIQYVDLVRPCHRIGQNFRYPTKQKHLSVSGRGSQKQELDCFHHRYSIVYNT